LFMLIPPSIHTRHQAARTAPAPRMLCRFVKPSLRFLLVFVNARVFK
jgi:hypothetical protein